MNTCLLLSESTGACRGSEDILEATGVEGELIASDTNYISGRLLYPRVSPTNEFSPTNELIDTALQATLHCRIAIILRLITRIYDGGSNVYCCDTNVEPINQIDRYANAAVTEFSPKRQTSGIPT